MPKETVMTNIITLQIF